MRGGLGITGIDGIKKIEEIVKPYGPEVISLDPLYKIATGAENAAEDLKGILNAFDELSRATGAAIPFVHHDAKGASGDRDIRDRGAGSNVLGRDYDACITLTPHASEPDAVVVESSFSEITGRKSLSPLYGRRIPIPAAIGLNSGRISHRRRRHPRSAGQWTFRRLLHICRLPLTF